MIEAVTSIVAYLVLIVLSSWAATVLAKDISTRPLFIFYGLFLLANLVYETSVGALQTLDQFGRVARVPTFIKALLHFC